MKRFSERLRIIFAQVCSILALNLSDKSCSSRRVLLPESPKPLPHAAGSYELSTPLALVVIVYLGNTFVLRKSFSLLSSFKEMQWPIGEDGIHRYDPANEEFKMVIQQWRCMTTR